MSCRCERRRRGRGRGGKWGEEGGKPRGESGGEGGGRLTCHTLYELVSRGGREEKEGLGSRRGRVGPLLAGCCCFGALGCRRSWMLLDCPGLW